jgi:biotin transporter BioY
MPKFIRNDDNQRTDSRWAVSILVGIMVACLLGFIASYTMGTLWLSHAAQAEFAGAVTLGSEPTLVAAKKPVRYEAVIANWKRHRSVTERSE